MVGHMKQFATYVLIRRVIMKIGWNIIIGICLQIGCLVTPLAAQEKLTYQSEFALDAKSTNLTPDTQSIHKDKHTEKIDETTRTDKGKLLFGLGILYMDVFRDPSDSKFGINIKLAYELSHIRLYSELGGYIEQPDLHFLKDDHLLDHKQDPDGSFLRLDIGASVFPILRKGWSPYVGLGLSMFGFVQPNKGHGMGLNLHAGAELRNFGPVTMQVEVGCTTPFYYLVDTENGKQIYSLMGHASLSILW